MISLANNIWQYSYQFIYFCYNSLTKNVFSKNIKHAENVFKEICLSLKITVELFFIKYYVMLPNLHLTRNYHAASMSVLNIQEGNSTRSI